MRGITVRKKFTELADFGPLRIRLQRFGRTNQAYYQIVVAQARFRRDGRVHDVLGMFSPHPTSEGYKHVNLDFARAKHWIAAGAEPTSTVARLLSKAGLLPSAPKSVELLKQHAQVRQLAESRPGSLQ